MVAGFRASGDLTNRRSEPGEGGWRELPIGALAMPGSRSSLRSPERRELAMSLSESSGWPPGSRVPWMRNEAAERLAGDKRRVKPDGFWWTRGSGANTRPHDSSSGLRPHGLLHRVAGKEFERLQIWRRVVHVHAGHLGKLPLVPRVELVS